MHIYNKHISEDNMAKKYIQKTADGYLVETTYVDYHNKHIICYSSQIGCKMECNFCYSGVHPSFYRNLTYEELVSQCSNIIEEQSLSDKPILFSAMGVGEPLLNYDNLILAIKTLNKKYPNSKFALATTGVIPDLITKLAEDLKEIKNFKLTLSLHGASDETRNKIIPNSISIAKLIESVKKYTENSGREVEWNYVLLKSINDSIQEAKDLTKLLGPSDCIKINKYNIVEGSLFESSNEKTIREFQELLKSYHMKVEYYETNGSDILGACGQMVCRKIDEQK